MAPSLPCATSIIAVLWAVIIGQPHFKASNCGIPNPSMSAAEMKLSAQQ